MILALILRAAVALSIALPSARVPCRVVAAAVTAADREGVSPWVLLALGWSESRLTTVAAASPFGVRVHHRYVAGIEESAGIAARSLRLWTARCGGELRGLAAWRTGRGCRAADGGYGLRVTGLAARIERASLGVVLLTGEPLVLRLTMGGGW